MSFQVWTYSDGKHSFVMSSKKESEAIEVRNKLKSNGIYAFIKETFYG